MKQFNNLTIEKDNIKERLLFAGMLILLGVLFRTTWHLAPNVEFITCATLIAASYLGKKWAIVIPLVIMAATDFIIGNTNIFLFTWSGFFFIGCLGNLSHLYNIKRGKRVLLATGLGIVASVWFYLWTNFGVWLLDSWGMYPKTLIGLFDAYILALPFLKYNLIGNLIFVPVTFTAVELARYYKLSKIIKKLDKFARI